MATSSDKSFGKGEKPEPPTKPSAAGPGDKPERVVDQNLPMVEAPKLADGDPIVSAAADSFDEMPKIAAGETIIPPAVEAVQAASAPRWSRFAMLAATVALAAGVGSFAGALAVSGIAGHAPSRVAMADAQSGADSRAKTQQLAEAAAAINSSLDSTNRSTAAQFAKLAERLDKLERTQADPAKLAQMADAIDRIDKRTAAFADITGSIQASASAAAAKLPVVEGWIVEDVQDGRALVASRYGGEFEVATGAVLPGLGRVEAVKRQDGQWVVVTARGLITSGR